MSVSLVAETLNRREKKRNQKMTRRGRDKGIRERGQRKEGILREEIRLEEGRDEMEYTIENAWKWKKEGMKEGE